MSKPEEPITSPTHVNTNYLYSDADWAKPAVRFEDIEQQLTEKLKAIYNQARKDFISSSSSDVLANRERVIGEALSVVRDLLEGESDEN